MQMGPEIRNQDHEKPIKELGAAILILGFLVPFSTKISEIYVDPSDPGFGSQDFPKLIIWLGITLSAILGGKAVIGLWAMRPKGFLSHIASAAAGPLLLFCIAFSYIYAIDLFQYALPTFVLLVFLMWYFGNRGPKGLVIIPAIAVSIYYFVFFVLFGVFEERGEILSYDSYGFARTIRSWLGF